MNNEQKKLTIRQIRKMHDEGNLDTGIPVNDGDDLPDDFWETAKVVRRDKEQDK